MNQVRIFRGYGGFWYAELWESVNDQMDYEWKEYLKSASREYLLKEVENKGWFK